MTGLHIYRERESRSDVFRVTVRPTARSTQDNHYKVSLCKIIAGVYR